MPKEEQIVTEGTVTQVLPGTMSFRGRRDATLVEFSPGYGLHQGYLPGVPGIARLHPHALLESTPVLRGRENWDGGYGAPVDFLPAIADSRDATRRQPRYGRF